ncbi:hypothetical protein L202_06578 [Cryptococcus amylolentus CBS 6039]|uniref:CNNM transmembrane domain-containing protein n=1 Tax=Cryptococcus amylolentus CBS 6039 TaxID=1295533 RepID=A0A1E3HGG3_9TREE|nr:hypothetical protein L202_06578 [Cryptococcus amylolentus CBS 6039]ODN75427.1 hypothetical protein L202_06578 [Cryptococcus amylolentus CBS 6039]
MGVIDSTLILNKLLVDTNNTDYPDKHVHVPLSSPLFFWYIAAIMFLVLLGGVFSGLTLGLMGLDTVNLQVLSVAGTEDERRQAPRVLKLVGHGRHTMLVVLLLGNTLINTSLPIFLDSIVGGGWIAVLGSTFLILTRRFRILPQSICNRYGLAIGSTFAPLVRFLIVLMYPIAKPIGIVLDFVLGAHSDPVTYRKAELKTFVSLGVEDKLEEDELGLLGSVLEFSGKTVKDIMTSHEDMYALSAERIVDGELVKEILKKGYSRIPVYEPSSRDSYIGCITIRALVGYDWTDLKPVSDFVTQALPQCFSDLNLIEAMSYFQTGRSHIMLITHRTGDNTQVLGLVTLEDVVEALIGREIIVRGHKI